MFCVDANGSRNPGVGHQPRHKVFFHRHD